MPRTAWRFTNPSNSATYDFVINPSEEEEFGQSRNIEHAAKTGLTGLVRQQGENAPLILKSSGSILTRAQLIELNGWFALCRTQTIYLRDHANDNYEGLLTAFKPTRKRTLRNPRDQTNAPLWWWQYTMEFEVVRVISGAWAGAQV